MPMLKFLMHRVELKALSVKHCQLSGDGFLMHRVELKESIVPGLFRTVTLVPNAPCGVESTKLERKVGGQTLKFLMHRVELKVNLDTGEFFSFRTVPNAPCGVERLPFSFHRWAK